MSNLFHDLTLVEHHKHMDIPDVYKCSACNINYLNDSRHQVCPARLTQYIDNRIKENEQQ